VCVCVGRVLRGEFYKLTSLKTRLYIYTYSASNRFEGLYELFLIHFYYTENHSFPFRNAHNSQNNLNPKKQYIKYYFEQRAIPLSLFSVEYSLDIWGWYATGHIEIRKTNNIFFYNFILIRKLSIYDGFKLNKRTVLGRIDRKI